MCDLDLFIVSCLLIGLLIMEINGYYDIQHNIFGRRLFNCICLFKKKPIYLALQLDFQVNALIVKIGSRGMEVQTFKHADKTRR